MPSVIDSLRLWLPQDDSAGPDRSGQTFETKNFGLDRGRLGMSFTARILDPIEMSHGHSNQSDSHATPLRGAHFDACRALRAESSWRPALNRISTPKPNASSTRSPDPAALGPEVRDLRDRPWSSIDNTESRDLDQIEMAEQLADGNIRLVVGIADVDALVPKGVRSTSTPSRTARRCTRASRCFRCFPKSCRPTSRPSTRARIG